MRFFFVYISMRERERENDTTIAPSEKLRANILASIGREEYRRARAYLFGSAGVGLFSIFGIVFSAQYLLGEFYQSSFYAYLSLLLSDPRLVLAYRREFILSLAESLPLFGVIVIGATLFSFLSSLKILSENLPAFGARYRNTASI